MAMVFWAFFTIPRTLFFEGVVEGSICNLRVRCTYLGVHVAGLLSEGETKGGEDIKRGVMN